MHREEEFEHFGYLLFLISSLLVAGLLGEYREDKFDLFPCEGNYLRAAINPHDGIDLRPRFFEMALEHGWALRELTRKNHSLEDIYVQLTRPDEEDET